MQLPAIRFKTETIPKIWVFPLETKHPYENYILVWETKQGKTYIQTPKTEQRNIIKKTKKAEEEIDHFLDQKGMRVLLNRSHPRKRIKEITTATYRILAETIIQKEFTHERLYDKSQPEKHWQHRKLRPRKKNVSSSKKWASDQAIQISGEDFNALFGVEYLVNGIQEFLIDPKTKEIEYNFVDVREDIEGYGFSAETGEDFLTLYAKPYREEIINEIEDRLNIHETDKLQKLRNEIFEKEKE